MKRLARSVVLGTVAMAAGAGVVAAPALAAPSSGTWPVTINVRAAPATENNIIVEYHSLSDTLDVWHFIGDGAGITTIVTEPPTCYPREPRVVICPDGAPGQGESFSFFLGDMDDRFTAARSPGEFAVRAGPGDDHVEGTGVRSEAAEADEPVFNFTEDTLYGDAGDDYLLGGRGPDYLAGGSGNDILRGGYAAPGDDFGPSRDNLRGGPGNDLLDATTHRFGGEPRPQPERDLVIDCGPGRRDKARIDRIDPKPKGCEVVKRLGVTPDFNR